MSTEHEHARTKSTSTHTMFANDETCKKLWRIQQGGQQMYSSAALARKLFSSCVCVCATGV